MKIMIISLALIIILIFIWGWFHYTYVDVTVTYYWENLTRLSDIIEDNDWNKAESDMKTYLDKWNKAKEIWIYFINQSNIDNIDASINKLEVYIKNSNKVMSQAEAEELKVLFNVIRENECLTWDNIF